MQKSQVLCGATGLEMTASIQGPERRIVIVGQTGNGKSETGNTILGSKVFETGWSLQSITEACQKEEAQLNGRKIVVVDTPGFSHANLPNEDIATQVNKCVKLCSPGPHVILQVMRPRGFTENEKAVAQQIKEIFGLKARNYMILLFTHKDELERESLERFISVQDKKLKEYIAVCGNRYLAFNNKAEGVEREAQVAELMTMMDELVQTNRHAPCYTEDMMNFNRHNF
ncbi:GTPase IMAP family member 4-like [Notechis scutatus]|uniref:GTPase IMAP family member 4-like n=1 Tax=Notechis scutatus TaxID=8663 RepID=A0A6J1V4F8_9SAUR|nr:GTPase IMAP family member 4-like [Notechis scutatus]